MRHPSDDIPNDEVCEAARRQDERMRTSGWGWPSYLGTYSADEIDDAEKCFIQVYDFVIQRADAIDRCTGEALPGWYALYGR